ncbi:MAG TPA: LPXTG cell wall anchor domain-containing protein [Acidobacteriaceae bacterium]|jgi:LPXTG-motif cell wall-anchored protein|nr:LPXTG cell wall anchor domain-containing protein [Acidobacteriaceae bacterium]
MKILNILSCWFALGAISALILASSPSRAAAQDTTITSVQPGTPSLETSVKNAQVVYVEGNDLVLKLEDGKIEHLRVPDSDVFTIDGQDVSIRDLKPGTRLAQTITTTTTPHYVNSVQTIKGKVWHVQSPTSVIVSLPDGTNQIFRVPSHAKFFVNGQPRESNELRRGMAFEATIITDDTHRVVSQDKTMVGQAPAPLPRLVGVLLFPRLPAALTPEATPVGNVTAEHAWAQASLPQTGSPLPLIALLGLMALALGLGLRVARKVNTY